jgi:hypothetical protein
MAATLKVYLVNQAGDLSGRFEDSHRKACADKLKAYFDAIISGVGKYDAVSVTWTGKAADPTAFDFVCYVLTSAKGSIVATKATGDVTLGVSGSTLLSVADKAVVSEIYLQQIVQKGDPRANATANREIVVANCILHELAHNLLDATRPEVLDVHKVKGGVICRETGDKALGENDSPSNEDNAAFRTGFGRRTAGVKQYTGGMT